MYALTRSFVYDRYVLPWAVLLALVWVLALPKRILAVQGLLLAAIFAWHAWRLLIRLP